MSQFRRESEASRTKCSAGTCTGNVLFCGAHAHERKLANFGLILVQICHTLEYQSEHKSTHFRSCSKLEQLLTGTVGSYHVLLVARASRHINTTPTTLPEQPGPGHRTRARIKALRLFIWFLREERRE